MSPEAFTLEPEVEAILREVAADPDSGLLRVERRKAARELMQRTPGVGPATAGLSAAEREIVTVHRAEVATVLRQAAWTQLCRIDSSTQLVSKHLAGGKNIESLSVREVQQRATVAAATHSLATPDRDTFEFCAHNLTGPAHKWPMPLSLCAASHRLLPTNQARLLGGLSLMLQAQPQGGVALMRSVCNNSPSHEHLVAAWINVGLAWSIVGGFHQSLEAYEHASRLDQSRTIAFAYTVALALQCGSKARGIQASVRLAEMVDEADVVIDWYVSSLRSRRSAYLWRPTPLSQQLLAHARSEFTGPGRRIADAFA